MSGHSKWSTIKHKKAANDAKRGKVFTKLIREIMVAAKSGGSDVNHNAKLRTVIDKAKKAGMPLDNITRAAKKGAGELEGESYEEVVYEGRGPGGTALWIDTLTDNRQRTVMELRFIFSRNAGELGKPGSAAYLFNVKGLTIFSKDKVKEDQLMDTLLEAGAEDIATNDDGDFEVTCDPANLHQLQEAARAANLEWASSEVTKIPTTTVKLTSEDARKVLKIMDLLDDHDDVQNVYVNADFSDDDLNAAMA